MKQELSLIKMSIYPINPFVPIIMWKGGIADMKHYITIKKLPNTKIIHCIVQWDEKKDV